MHSNAVSQFETWSREESSFRAATINADRERKRIEESLFQLRTQQKKLSTDARKSSDLLGRLHRDCGLLEQERERLLRQLKEERTLLEHCTQDAEELQFQETSAKTAFYKQIDSENTELTDLLLQQEDFYLQSILGNETVSALQEYIANEFFSDCKFMDTLKAWSAIANSNENVVKEIEGIKKSIEIMRARSLEVEVQENNGVCDSSEYIALVVVNREYRWNFLILILRFHFS
jgi:hypothetical protein